MKVLSTENIPIKLWLEDIELGALKQAKNLANLPFAFKHIAVMPDSHQGYGMPIGGVLATKGVIIPNAVGVDIGCGMCAVRTNFHSINQEGIKALFGGSKEYKGGIRSKVPVGYGHHSNKQDEKLMPEDKDFLLVDEDSIVGSEYQSALKQLGTLGGGNHFLEVQKVTNIYDKKVADAFGLVEKDQVAIMLHCGSRGFGHQVATDYLKILGHAAKKYGIELPDRQLVCAPANSKEGQDYYGAMKAAVNYAFCNRQVMTHWIREGFEDVFNRDWEAMDMDTIYDVCHNICKFEEHIVDGEKRSEERRVGKECRSRWSPYH